MKADLHVHSNFSDGSNSVRDAMKQAYDNGITHISFVDHDTVAGLPEVQRQGSEFGITVIPGIEISAYDFKRNRKVHVLGYNYQTEAVNIKETCDQILKRRHKHSLWQADRIRAAGYSLDMDAIIEAAKPSNTVYKQHIMQALTDAAFTAAEYKQLYIKLFKGDGVASGDTTYVDVFDAVRAIIADGGVAVIAHPGQLDSYDLIPELVQIGLGGIERNHLDHSAKDAQKVETLAKQYNLIMTGGTDYHGSFGEAIEIGSISSPFNRLLE
ncbi:PHP domain-containing protein [Oceanobacillus sp. 143]|uniref:Phosphatase n=1 Tax=Oceanobacillus zhaokaii TaxID=2052660 RepID=A0A345PLI9_9BACI|nr:PHP domain-containing protein [Oceanobacillus zhaokaii]AXI10869.1 phosphatase [Oceanobacillus zhaokaii]QGS69737.1 PHP domain-containing protein [Oceanobacillus sp. 143]